MAFENQYANPFIYIPSRPFFLIPYVMVVITWGIITCCMAAVTNYGSLIACRVLMYVYLSFSRGLNSNMVCPFRGAAEAGYFPCVRRLLYIS